MSDEDLGELCARATRRLVAGERPLLEAHGLTMWQYIALSALARESARSQLELARAIRYDKTRLIGLLDGLETAGLVSRRPDPADRRARLVSLTPEGSRRHAAIRRDIRAMEATLMEDLDPSARASLRSGLRHLAYGSGPKTG